MKPANSTRAPYIHRGDVRPDDQGPPPGEKGATHDEADEQQMDDHQKVSANPVPHLVTLSGQHIEPTIGLTARSARVCNVHYCRDGAAWCAKGHSPWLPTPPTTPRKADPPQRPNLVEVRSCRRADTGAVGLHHPAPACSSASDFSAHRCRTSTSAGFITYGGPLR